MTNVAVEDRPTISPDTAGAELGDTADDLNEDVTGAQGDDNVAAQQAGADRAESPGARQEDKPFDRDALIREVREELRREQEADRERQEREEAENKRRQEQERVHGELRELRGKVLKDLPAYVNTLMEDAGLSGLSVAQAQPIIDMLQNLNTKAMDAAKAELGDQASGEATQRYNQLREDFSEAVYGLVPEVRHGDFSSAVRGKPAADWLRTAVDFVVSDLTTKMGAEAGSQISVDAKAPEEVQKAKSAFGDALSKAKAPGDVLKAAIDFARVVGSHAPIEEPNGTVLAPTTFRTGAEVDRAYNDGLIGRDEYARQYKQVTGREP